jgi:hypothetical protein
VKFPRPSTHFTYPARLLGENATSPFTNHLPCSRREREEGEKRGEEEKKKKIREIPRPHHISPTLFSQKGYPAHPCGLP